MYSNCPKKALKPDIMEYNPPPTPGLNQFWGSACPRMHIHEWYCIFYVSRFLKIKKNKKYLPTLPTFRPKGQTNLLFFMPNNKLCKNIPTCNTLALAEPLSTHFTHFTHCHRQPISPISLTYPVAASRLVVLSVGFRSPRELGKF